jgi:hypothetical protein
VLAPWSGGALPPLLLVAATAVGLLALPVGLMRLERLAPGDLARALAPALGGLSLVAALWGGTEALLPAARLAIFAPAVLWLLPPDATTLARRLPRLLPLATVFLAIAGAPLTVGFGALARLYANWLPAGAVLVFVVAALLAVWLAGVFRSARHATEGSTEGRPLASTLLGALPAAVAVLGLIQVRLPELSALPWPVWAAVALSALGGVALGRFVPALGELSGLLRESVAMPAAAGRVAARLGPPARRARALIAAALGDAAAILEGENGLLVLLALALLLWWMGR